MKIFTKYYLLVSSLVDGVNHLVDLLVGHLPGQVLQHELHLVRRYAPYSTVHCCSIVQYSTVLYCTVQYNTVQYSTVQYSTVQYSTVQYSTVQYSTVQYSTVQYSTVQYITSSDSPLPASSNQKGLKNIFHGQMLIHRSFNWKGFKPGVSMGR